MKNIVIGVLLASLLVACASDVPVGDLKKKGRPADIPLSAAADSAPGASVVVDALNDQNGVSQTSKSASTSLPDTAVPPKLIVACEAIDDVAAETAVDPVACAGAFQRVVAWAAVDDANPIIEL